MTAMYISQTVSFCIVLVLLILIILLVFKEFEIKVLALIVTLLILLVCGFDWASQFTVMELVDITAYQVIHEQDISSSDFIYYTHDGNIDRIEKGDISYFSQGTSDLLVIKTYRQDPNKLINYFIQADKNQTKEYYVTLENYDVRVDYKH